MTGNEEAGNSGSNDAGHDDLAVSSLRNYAIFMLDPEGIIASWNGGAQRLTGYVAAEVIDTHFSCFDPERDEAPDRARQALQAALAEGKHEDQGWRLRKDGSRFWASVVIDPVFGNDQRLIGYAHVMRDIAEQKKADEARSASEQQFRLLVQGVTDYAIYMLAPDGIVTNWNAGAQRIKGYRDTEVIGTHFSRFYTPEDRATGLPDLALATAATHGRFEQEGQRMRKDGSRFWAHVIVDPIRNDLGELIGFAKVTRDVTEKREAAEALETANIALFQSQKMEALGKLTGGVAHDFNNLLAVASSGMDVLVAQFPMLEGSRSLDSMRRAILRSASLTQQLLDFARQQPLKTERCELGKLITGFESVLRGAANASIRFHMKIAPQPIRISIDTLRLETALLNLVVNACHAMPQGGDLTIGVDQVVLRDHAVGALAAGAYARVTVTDTGIGMSDEVIRKAFEPFFTTKAPGKGTGLGLSQVYGFIAQSGGDVGISSIPGSGSTFTIHLPALESNSEEAATPDKPPPETALIVEDQQDLLELTVELFRILGYEPHIATNGAEALKIMERTKIDVMFSDVVMPNSINGIELARIVRSRWPATKTILASGYPAPALTHLDLTSDLSEFTFLSKPYQLADLVKALKIPATAA